jgi:CHAT domain-containing protein/Tfp pilus assembly protein PilF
MAETLFKLVIICFGQNALAAKRLRRTLILLLTLYQGTYSFNAETLGHRPPSVHLLEQQRVQEKNVTQTAAITTLLPGQAIEREISGGLAQQFQFTASAGQFVGVTVRQIGIDVGVKLFAPDGRVFADVDLESRPQGEERADFVAETAGVYRLEIKGQVTGTTGRYEIQVTEVRAATEHDRALAEAHKLSAQVLQFDILEKYNDAVSTAERAVEIGEKELGPDHPFVGYLRNQLAFSELNKGDYAKALQQYQRALTINQQALGAEHPQTVESIRQLGTTYGAMNQFDKGEELLQQALQVTEKTFGSDHPRVAQCLLALAGLHLRRSDLTHAEQEFQQAIAIIEKNAGADSVSLEGALNNLGMVYNSRKEFDRAEPLLQRAVEITEKNFGPDSPRLGMPLQNLGLIAVEKRKDYQHGLELYWRAVRVLEKGVGTESPRVAAILNNIANIYKSQGDFPRALEMHQRVYAIFEKSLGPYHGSTLVSLGNVARTYASMGDVPNAIKFQKLTDEVIENNLALNLAIGSERQKLSFFDSLSERTDRTISLHVNMAPDDPGARDLAVLAILQRKGRVLDAMSDSLAALRERLNSDDQKLLDQLNSTTSQLARLELNRPAEMSVDDFRKQVSVLEDQKENLESEISRRSAEFRAQGGTVTLAAVRKAIPRDAALIEFATYRPFNPRLDNLEAYGESRYIAYVVREQGDVQWKDLGPTKEIEARLNAFRQSLVDPERRDVRQLARAVDEQVMQPLRGLLGDARQLLLSVDASFNLIPFAALVDEQGKYLIERYSIAYLTSGRDLLRLQVSRQSKSAPVVVADPAFGDPPLINGNEPNGNGASATTKGPRINFSRTFFGPLPGVNDEVRALKELFPHATFLTREQATKTALEKIVAPSVLHVATHGYFLATPPQTGGTATPTSRGRGAIASTNNPLLRSGLALAGANRDDSGILTAFEASGLNLWGTKLVVLSACDTGLGEIRDGEGVYGLRRALVLAGAESQLMSLWQVSDRSTRDLMIRYYKNLTNGRGRGDSLRQAQLEMLTEKSHSHPYYWASFIQTGEWGNLDGKR